MYWTVLTTVGVYITILCMVVYLVIVFFRVKANAAFLCNYEVMLILQQLKENTQKKHKREGSLATVTYEVFLPILI